VTHNENKQDATTAAEPARPDTPSQYLGLLLKDRYLVERELGRGGLGVVYLARDRRLLSRPVVIKVLFAAQGNDRYDIWFHKKFRQEMEALSRINHPGVVGVLDAGEMPDGKSFLVMQYVEGVTLRSLMLTQGMDFGTVARIVRQMGQALSAAHEKGVFHRDLKPENIMLEEIGGGEHQVKLIDFGVARIKDSQVATDSEVTWIAGTPPYMAPEQLRGRPTAESDIYGLGAVAYEMVTGHPPFKADSAVDLYELQKQGEITNPKELRPNLPEAAQAAILRALSFNAADRYTSARDFGEELARALTGEPPPFQEFVPAVRQNIATASAEAKPTRPETSTRAVKATEAGQKPSKVRLALAGAAILLIAIGALAWNSFIRDEEPRPPAPMPERLSYWITVQKYRGGEPYQEPFRLAGEIIFESDYHVRLHVANRQPGFLYILNEGPKPENNLPSYVLLFPSPTANNGSAQLSAGQEIAIPEVGDGFVFDREQGTEKVWLIWSTQSLPEIEAVKGVVNPKEKGAISDPAQIIAIRSLIDKHRAAPVAVEKDEANKLTNIRGRGEALVHLIKLEHQ
jgi:serine/threonine protein kinase